LISGDLEKCVVKMVKIEFLDKIKLNYEELNALKASVLGNPSK